MQGRGGVAVAPDGVPIHYDVHGMGQVFLVFVHGWCCDRRYWRQQIDPLAGRFGIVCLDLAGHGESGCDRARFTIAAFAMDVVAVVQQLGLDRVVLIGHSMSGGVIVEAARHLGTAVIGLIGVDTMWNIDQDRSPEQVAAFTASFRADFPKAARAFVAPMFTPAFDADLAAQIISDVAAFPPAIGTQALESSMGNAANLRSGLDDLSVPVTLINSPHWRTTDLEGARRRGIDVTLMPHVGHFLMLEDPPAFNRLLKEAVQRVL